MARRCQFKATRRLLETQDYRFCSAAQMGPDLRRQRYQHFKVESGGRVDVVSVVVVVVVVALVRRLARQNGASFLASYRAVISSDSCPVPLSPARAALPLSILSRAVFAYRTQR